METREDKVAAMYVPFGEYVPKVAKLMIGHIWDMTRRSSTSADGQMDRGAWLIRLATVDNPVRGPKRTQARLLGTVLAEFWRS